MSSGFDADFFDGRTSRRRPVHVDSVEGKLAVRAPDFALDVRRDEVRIHPRVGTTPIRIDLPDGALLVAPDFDSVDATLEVPPARTLAHRLESHALFVVLALAGIVLAGFFLYTKGIPWAAREVALRLPPQIETELGQETLATFDNLFTHPTKLDTARRIRIQESFVQLRALAQVPPQTRIEFRDSPLIDANALTLPGGTIVVTDQLVNLLPDEEVAAVLAHELGHVHYRHGTRLVLVNSVHALFVMAVFGDANAVAGAAALAPTVLLNTGYSRDFEREADRFAFQLLPKVRLSPSTFASALEDLEDHFKEKKGRMGAMGYLSTHPDTADRIEAADAAAKGREPEQ